MEYFCILFFSHDSINWSHSKIKYFFAKISTKRLVQGGQSGFGMKPIPSMQGPMKPFTSICHHLDWAKPAHFKKLQADTNQLPADWERIDYLSTDSLRNNVKEPERFNKIP